MAIGLLQDDPMLLEFAKMYLIATSDNEEQIPEYMAYVKKYS
jgi:hypothetical protein